MIIIIIMQAAAGHPTANVTHRHSYLYQTHSRDMVTAIVTHRHS